MAQRRSCKLCRENSNSTKPRKFQQPRTCILALLNEKTAQRGVQREDYNFQEVRDFDDRIEGGLAGLNELCIPINVNNAHWIFIEVGFRTKEVHLFDSLGKHQSNNQRKTDPLSAIGAKDGPQGTCLTGPHCRKTDTTAACSCWSPWDSYATATTSAGTHTDRARSA